MQTQRQVYCVEYNQKAWRKHDYSTTTNTMIMPKPRFQGMTNTHTSTQMNRKHLQIMQGKSVRTMNKTGTELIGPTKNM